MAMPCEAQKRRASTLTNPPQPAMTMAAGILAPASYLRRRSASWTKSEPPLTVRHGLRGEDAGLDRETRAPEGVGLSIRGGVGRMRSGCGGQHKLRRWAKSLMSLQDGLKRRSRVWPRGRGG